MPEAILYCDHCTRMISAADVKSGEAVVTPDGAFCAACVQALEPGQREALRKLATGKQTDASLSSVFRMPKPPATRRPPTGKTTLPSSARRKRSQTTMLRAARAEPPAKSRAGAMALAGLGLGLLAGVLALMSRAPKPSRNRKPPPNTNRRSATDTAPGEGRRASAKTPVAISPITGRPIGSPGRMPFRRPMGTAGGRRTAPSAAARAGAVTVFKQGDVWRYFKGTIFPGAGWNGLGFDDSSWLSGPTGIGYGDNDDATVISDMCNGYITVYMRRKFTMGDAAAAKSLRFSVAYDDGFVAFINGDEVARRGVPAGQDQDTPAKDHEALTPEVIDLTAHKDSLVDGTNVFAIELHNRKVNSGDASMIPELTIEGGDAVGTSAAVEPAAVALDLERGLVAHWTFDETDGTTATDASGNGFTGSLRNMDQARPWVAGRVGGALELDGVDDYVLCGNDLKLSEFMRFTLAAWVKPDDTSTFAGFGDPIISKEGRGKGYQLTWHHDGRFGFMLADAHMTWSRRGKTNGTWYHVAAVFGKGTSYIYVDGVMEHEAAPGNRWNTVDPLCIGATQGNARHLKATIDDVRIYDRALTAEEILALVNAGPFAPTVTSTVRSSAYVGHRYSYTIRAQGAPPPAISVSGLPKWLSFDGKDTVSGTPGMGDIGATGTITMTAENAQGSDTQKFTIKVEELTLASGLLAHWRLDETSGTTAADSSGNGYTGTLTNMTGTEWTTGRIGGALSFNDAGDMVLVNGYVDLGAEWTIAAWFTAPLPAVANWHTLTRAEGDGEDHQVILNDTLTLGTYDNTTGWGFRSCGYSMAGLSNGWHHVAAVGTGTTTDFYVDGSFVGTSDRKSAGNVYCIGNYKAAGQRFSETLDDVRIYNRALSGEEIGELYRRAGAAEAVELPPAIPGPVAHWKFDETDGTVASDSSGSGNNGALRNMAGAEWTAGWIGGALSFDGTDDFVQVEDADVLDGTDGLTIAAWVRPAALDGKLGGIVSKRDYTTENESYCVFFGSGDRLHVDIDGRKDRFSSNTVFAAGRWYHIVVVYDGTLARAERVKLYVDGALDRTAGESSPSIPDYPSTLYLGKTDPGGHFAGGLDDVRIYSQALSADQVAGLYRSTGGKAKEAAPAEETPTPAKEGAPPARPGLLGEYYGGMALAGEAALVRIDSQIDFDWGTGPPDPKLPEDRFSVRWTGTIEPEYSETYTFHVYHDDGVKLWIGDDRRIDRWRVGQGEHSAMKTLEAGVKYSIKIEYYDRTGPARISLEWQSDSQPRELVPPSALSPPAERSP